MNNKNIVIGVVAILAVVFGVSYLKQTTVINQVNVPAQTQQTQQTFAGMPGNSLPGRQFSVNGVEGDYNRFGFTSATSTFCVIPPPQATSTISKFIAKNTSATSTAVYYLLEKRTNPYAPVLSAATSSNVVAAMLLASGDDEAFLVQATSTTVGTNTSFGAFDNLEVTPSQYLVLYGKAANGTTIPQATSIGTVFSGNCSSILLRE